jgi:hypothetical protein
LFQCSSSVPTGPMAKFSTSQVVIWVETAIFDTFSSRKFATGKKPKTVMSITPISTVLATLGRSPRAPERAQCWDSPSFVLLFPLFLFPPGGCWSSDASLGSVKSSRLLIRIRRFLRCVATQKPPKREF